MDNRVNWSEFIAPEVELRGAVVVLSVIRKESSGDAPDGEMRKGDTVAVFRGFRNNVRGVQVYNWRSCELVVVGIPGVKRIQLDSDAINFANKNVGLV